MWFGYMWCCKPKQLETCQYFEYNSRNPLFLCWRKKIMYMFDVPHLIKLARNNLMKNYFVFDDKVTWEHLETFYLHDKQYSTRAAPKLSDSHMNPSPFGKMKVKYATQVLSVTVLAGMDLYIRFGVLPAAAVGTSELIDRFDKLFDILNSSSLHCSKMYDRAFKNDDYQKEFISDCKEVFKSVKIIDKNNRDVTNSVKCIKGWGTMIRAFELLWDKVRKVGFQYLLSRRLNQDALENLFGKIRQQNGNCINTTPIQFQRTFRKLLCLDILNSGSENCQGDPDKVLLNFADFPKCSTEDEVPVETLNTLDVDCNKFKQVTSTEGTTYQLPIIANSWVLVITSAMGNKTLSIPYQQSVLKSGQVTATVLDLKTVCFYCSCFLGMLSSSPKVASDVLTKYCYCNRY